MKLQALLGCVLALALVGCSSADYSKNMRAATAQATATVATKALLDEVPVAQYDATKAKVVEVMGEVSKFLDTGKIGDLPFDAAKDAIVKFMREKGWDQYIPAVEGILDIIAAQKVPVEKLGADNIAIIKLGLASAANSAETSKVEWRRPAARDGSAGAPPPNRVRLFRR
jgi:hypothetical protein